MQTLKANWYLILAVVMLLLAIPSIWPYYYYQILRWVVMIAATYAAFQQFAGNDETWGWVLAAIAILFNPIIPINFQKDVWTVIDAIVAAALAGFLYVQSRANQKRGGR